MTKPIPTLDKPTTIRNATQPSTEAQENENNSYGTPTPKNQSPLIQPVSARNCSRLQEEQANTISKMKQSKTVFLYCFGLKFS